MQGYYEESDEVREARINRQFRNREHYSGTNDQPGLFIFQDTDDEWCVWLNPEGGIAQTGTCLGVGKSRQEAVQDATNALEWALTTLQETPAPSEAPRARPRRRG